MLFASTRDSSFKLSFQNALFQGLSPDGGLFYPTEIPDMQDLFRSFTASDSFNQIASSVLHTFLKDELSKEDAIKLAKRAFPFEPALKKLNDQIQILELFHGPSSAFKDFGASFSGNIHGILSAEQG